MMSAILTHISNIGEAAIAKPMAVVISGFCTVLLSAAITTTEFASQYPGIMITIISTIGAFCLVLIGVIYKNQMSVNSEVLKGMKELNAEMKANRELAMQEIKDIRNENKHTEERLQDKIEQVQIARNHEKNIIGESLEEIRNYRLQAEQMNLTLQEITKAKTKK